MDSPKSLFNAIHTKERGHGKFVKPNFHAPCANSVSCQSVITQRPNIHRRTSCRNCFGVGRVHIRPDALRFQLHCLCRVSRRAWSTLQCGKAWWLVPSVIHVLLSVLNGYLTSTFLPFLISSPRWLLPTRRPDRS